MVKTGAGLSIHSTVHATNAGNTAAQAWHPHQPGQCGVLPLRS